MTNPIEDDFRNWLRRPRRIAAAIAAAAAVGAVAIAYWPPATLRDRVRQIETLALVPPVSDGRSPWSFVGRWYRVDAGRRAQLVTSGGTNAEFVDLAIKLAAGQPFLVMVSPEQALITTQSGPVLLFGIYSGNPAGLARDAKGGPVLDLKPYKVAPRYAAVPVEQLLDLVTPEPGGEREVDWRLFLVRPAGSFNDHIRQSITIRDPLVALRFGTGGRP